MSACHEIPTISRQELHTANNVFCQRTDCIGSGGKHFSASVVALFSYY